jgi:hypothetical protein
MTRSEAFILWTMLLELQRKDYAKAEQIGIELWRDALLDFRLEDTANTIAELKQELSNDR